MDSMKAFVRNVSATSCGNNVKMSAHRIITPTKLNANVFRVTPSVVAVMDSALRNVMIVGI